MQPDQPHPTESEHQEALLPHSWNLDVLSCQSQTTSKYEQEFTASKATRTMVNMVGVVEEA